MLLFSLPGFYKRWLFSSAAGNVTEVPVTGSIMMSNAAALRDCMLAGIGPALLADWLIDADIAAGRCRDVFPDYRAAATSFDTGAWLIYPTRRFVPNKVRAAVDFLKQKLRRPS